MPFRQYDPSVKQGVGLVVAPWGREKVGKTHFALSFPAPLYLFNLDFGFEPIALKVPGKELYIADYRLKTPGDTVEAARVLKAIEADVDAALVELRSAATQGRHGTAVIDTASQWWQIVQTVYLNGVVEKRAKKEKVDPDLINVYPFDYGKANAYMGSQLRRFVYAAEEYGINAVFINRCKQKYNSRGEAQNQWEFNGFGETLAIAPLVLALIKRGEGADTQFCARVQSCRYDFSTEGLEFQNPDYDLCRTLAGLENE